MSEQSQQLPYSPHEIEAMLALATTGEQPAGDSLSTNTDYSRLTAREIVTAIRAVRDAELRELQEHQSKSGLADPIEVSDVDRRLAEYDLDTLLDQIPRLIGVEKTRDVFTMLAGGSSIERSQAAGYIGALTKVDHDYGLELWKYLLEHDDPDTGRDAFSSLIGPGRDLDEDPAQLMDSLADDGLTLHDFAYLMTSYVRRLHRRLDESAS